MFLPSNFLALARYIATSMRSRLTSTGLISSAILPSVSPFSTITEPVFTAWDAVAKGSTFTCSAGKNLPGSANTGSVDTGSAATISALVKLLCAGIFSAGIFSTGTGSAATVASTIGAATGSTAPFAASSGTATGVTTGTTAGAGSMTGTIGSTGLTSVALGCSGTKLAGSSRKVYSRSNLPEGQLNSTRRETKGSLTGCVEVSLIYASPLSRVLTSKVNLGKL